MDFIELQSYQLYDKEGELREDEFGKPTKHYCTPEFHGLALYLCHIIISCDGQVAILELIASRVVVVVAMYGELWLVRLYFENFQLQYELPEFYRVFKSSQFCKFGGSGIHCM